MEQDYALDGRRQKVRVECAEHDYDGGKSEGMPPLNTVTVNLDHYTRQRSASAME